MSTENKNMPRLRFPGFTGEWMEKKLGEVAEFQNGFAYNGSSFSNEGNYVIRISDIQDGVISLKSAVHSLTDVSDAFKVSKGDILIAMSGATTGKIGEYQNNEVAYINQRVGNIKPFGMNKKLLLFLLQSDFFIHYLNSILTVGAQPNISSQQICAFGFMLPKNTAEQQKIAECLTAIDDLIVAQGKKVDALKEHKKGLMQQLFPQQGETTPRLRFPGFTGEWVEKKLGEVFTRLTDRNIEDNRNVLTISAQFGLINQRDFFKKSIASADITGYYLLQKGDFAYNKSSSQGKPVGAIKPLKFYEKGVVSTLYICFRCNDSREIDFWEQYFDAGILDREIISIAQEGARNHGLLNVPTNAFFELNLISPTLAEQQKIAECLSTLDDQIKAESAELDALKEHKKGLMQQLFPQPTK